MDDIITGTIGEIMTPSPSAHEPIDALHILHEETTEEKQVSVIPEKVLERSKKWIMSYHAQNGKIPAKVWMQKKLNISHAKITEIIKALVSSGFLEQKKNRYYLSQNPDELHIPSVLDKVKAAAKLSPVMLFVKTILFFVGCGAVYMSIYHSKDYLSEFYSPTRAIVSATIMIIFNVLAAEMIVFFQIKKHNALSVVFAVILILGTVFSMGSTVIGLYNARAKEITKAYSIENVESRDLEEIQKEYDSILSRKIQSENNLNSERIKRDGLVVTLNKYTPEMIQSDLENYNKMNGRRYVADVRVDSAFSAYNGILNEEKKFLELNTVTAADKKEIPSDAYTWIGGTVFPNVSPATLQFWMSAYPALFYDIIAPVSFSVVFFVTGNKKKKERVRKKKNLFKLFRKVVRSIVK